MQSPPFPRYLVPPRSKYSPQHHVLKHPQLPFLPQCQRPSFTPIQNNRQDYSTIYFDLYTTLVLAMFYRWENCFPTIGGNVFQWASTSREFGGRVACVSLPRGSSRLDVCRSEVRGNQLLTQIVVRNKTGESLGLQCTNKFWYYSLWTRLETDRKIQETDKAIGKELKDDNSQKKIDVTLHRGSCKFYSVRSHVTEEAVNSTVYEVKRFFEILY